MAKKKKRDIGKIATRVIAAVLALMFVVSMARGLSGHQASVFGVAVKHSLAQTA